MCISFLNVFLMYLNKHLDTETIPKTYYLATGARQLFSISLFIYCFTSFLFMFLSNVC